MDFIIDAIVEWLKGLLVDGIMGNLDGLFDNVNQSVGEIATQVGTTPADWNAGVFSMIRQISETAILPIAGVILTFVMTYELIQMLIERNNLHEVDTWMFFKWVFKTFVAVMILTNALKATHVPNSTGYFRCTKRTENKGCPGCGKIRKEEFEQFIFSAMQEKFKDFQILHGREEKVNPKLTAYQVELAQVEAEIEKLLDTLTGANATLLAYANKKIEELDTRRQTISKAIAELSVETISPQQIKKLSYYLDNWDSIDFDDKRKAADGLISTIKATSDRVQIEWKI